MTYFLVARDAETGELGVAVQVNMLRSDEVWWVGARARPRPLRHPAPRRSGGDRQVRLRGGASAACASGWTADSWSRQENVVVVADSQPLAHAYALNFEELWEGGLVESSGKVEPCPVDVGGIEVRPWFAPGNGEELAHRIGQARRRVRIAAPVLTSPAPAS